MSARSEWLTPDRSDANGIRMLDGKRSGGLNTQVTDWQTQEAKNGSSGPDLARRHRAGSGADDLVTVVERNLLTCSSADSPAKTCPTPASVPVWQGPDPASGISSTDALANFDRGSSSWKTSQACLFEGSTPFSDAWPTEGMTRNGQLFARPMLARRTDASGCSSSEWKTPTREDCQDREFARNNRGEPKLSAQVWHSPCSGDSKDVPYRRDHGTKGMERAALLGQARGDWATPSTTDYKGSVTPAAARAELSNRGVRLPEQLTKLDGPPDQANPNTTGNPRESLPRPVLNPRWVLTLMGFPPTYLDGVVPPSRR